MNNIYSHLYVFEKMEFYGCSYVDIGTVSIYNPFMKKIIFEKYYGDGFAYGDGSGDGSSPCKECCSNYNFIAHNSHDIIEKNFGFI